MVSFRRRRRHHLAINITSLIDVIFMLLIFFMLASRFDTPVISIQLPTASSGSLSTPKKLEIVLDKEGFVYFDGYQSPLDSFEKIFVSWALQQPEMTVALSCDKEVSYQKIIALLDILQRNGFSRVVLRHRYEP
ncbi:MAG: biopolymer transporter ExbD [Breznakiellaceae bacterium]